jgi:Pyruvate/2-oxoacid:ferredoxin oxidoreductase delta subunit
LSKRRGKVEKSPKYSTLIVYYFSGTGNAANASRVMVNYAKNLGMQTHLISVDRYDHDIKVPEFEGKALIGFAAPVHGFYIAPIMGHFISDFPRGVNADIFILNTRAGVKIGKCLLPGISGMAFYEPSLMLRMKGYKNRGFLPIDLPSNWISIHPGLTNNAINVMYDFYTKKTERLLAKMLDGGYVYNGWYALWIDLPLIPITLAYSFVGRYGIAKAYMADSKCTNCGICIENCPTESLIRINNRPYWKYTCENCMRCMNSCPERAIQTPHLFAFIIWFLAYYAADYITRLIYSNYICNISTLCAWKTEVINFLIVSVLWVGISTFGFYLLHLAMGIKFIRKMVEYTSLTKLLAWRRYKPKRIK